VTIMERGQRMVRMAIRRMLSPGRRERLMFRDIADDQTRCSFADPGSCERNHLSVKLTMAALMLVAAPLEAVAREHGKPRDPNTIIAIVIHAVGGPACIANTVQFRPIPVRSDDAEFWQKIMKGAPSAEAHYVIGRAGVKKQVMLTTEIANHAVGVNPISIGIELVNRGDGIEPFEEPQILTLIETIKEIRRELPKISIANIVMHSDLDQRTCPCGGATYPRRQDPGANFPMQRIINEVRVPTDGDVGVSTLPRLVGPAPMAACATYQR